ncbi:MAG: hypothetical protein FWD39_02395 [Clostridiales bacterium]|nr:hypothetical protein [Clostridiales bacterium]
MKRPVSEVWLALWGRHLMLCGWGFLAFVGLLPFITHDLHNFSPLQVIIIPVFIIMSYSYAALGYKVNNDENKHAKPILIILSVSAFHLMVSLVSALSPSRMFYGLYYLFTNPSYMFFTPILENFLSRRWFSGWNLLVPIALLPSSFMLLGYWLKNRRRRKA